MTPMSKDGIDLELQRLDRLANAMDTAFRIPGTPWRMGVDALIGLIPGVGDAAGGLVSLYVVGRAWRLSVPLATRIRMLGNIALELLIGPIPVLGDLFDIWFKANRRNVDLLKKAIQKCNP